jgi:thioredoxin reductase (NADPH)
MSQVNVGCVPKKLMHHAALMGHSFEQAQQFGWKVRGFFSSSL